MIRKLSLAATLTVLCSGLPAMAQMGLNINLSSYGGTHQEARNARGFCWDKVGLAKTSNPQNEAQASAIRNCVDRVLAGNVPAKSAPPAQSARGRCIQGLPGSVFNKETRRYSNSNSAMVNEKCGPAN